MKLPSILVIIVATFVISLLAAEDYYQLLEISRDADSREIRKAYKKLALKYHPDKNKGDETVHEKFLRINKAYETLKDEESRRKYDIHGEDGPTNNFKASAHYQSWNYFENFGIYDDDPEIITLSKSDFDQSVLGTSDVWFVNFYSPMCSHCHHLAPAWRDMARELQDVIRVGAVNCEEEWNLCRQQGINSYPSLMLYPQKQKYQGDRNAMDLIDFIQGRIPSKLIHLNDENIQHYLKSSKHKQLPWLIFFCDHSSGCPSDRTQWKVAIMMENFANVAVVPVIDRYSFSSKLHNGTGVIYFNSGQLFEPLGKEIKSLDAQEITRATLTYFPELPSLDGEALKEIRTGGHIKDALPSIVCFINGHGDEELNFRKLPFLLGNVKVLEVDCSRHISRCQDIHITKYPAFAVFKPGGKHELYHGRKDIKDIAAFVRESLASTVESLGPEDFPARIIDGGEPWFVDFYAPWCPPCLRLLPEWRKLSQTVGNMVNLGTVDCTVHHDLCSRYNIHSYPTTIFYNRSIPHYYHGQGTVYELTEFVKDILSPPVLPLTLTTFTHLVADKSLNDIWVVDFFAPWCGPCQQLAPQFRKMAKLLVEIPNVHVAHVDCPANKDLCDSQGIQSYPTIRLYPLETTKLERYVTYGSYNRDASSLRAWVVQFLPSHTSELGNNEFYNQIIYNTDPWLVYFYTPWCHYCQVFSPEFEIIAQRLSTKLKVGKINCDSTQFVCQQAGVRAYPMLKFYPGSARWNEPQDTIGREIPSRERSTVISLVETWLEDAKEKHPRDEL